jgi:hypothetical protein
VEFLSLLLRESESAWIGDYGTIPGELGKSARRATINDELIIVPQRLEVVF